MAGIIIADFSRVLAGPLATMMLGDLGARIIKIERPGKGDETRAWGPPFTKEGLSAYFLSVNRNKESIALDLTDSAQREIAQQIQLDAAEILFLSDVADELDAAESAGMNTLQLVRDDKVVPGTHRVVRDFDAVQSIL